MKKLLVTIITFLIILILIVFQLNFLNKFPLFSIIPTVGIIFVSALGVISGEFVGGCVGAVYGLLIDSFCSKTFGIYLALYIFLGVFSGFLKNRISTNNKLSLCFLVVISTILFELIYAFSYKILYGVDISLIYLLRVLVLEEIYNLFLTYVLFRPFLFWGEIINRSKNSYYNIA